MTVRVVERLEVVDVDHHHADRVVRAPPVGEQAAELVEVATVRQAREGIGRRARLGRTMRICPTERGRGLGRGVPEHPRGRRTPRIRKAPRQHDRAHDQAVGAQGHLDRVPEPIDLPDAVGDPRGDTLSGIAVREGRRTGPGRPQ